MTLVDELGLEFENQRCDLCRKKVLDVEPASYRGGPLFMVCTACRALFPLRDKVFWGKYEYQFTWDLGKPPVIISGSKKGGKVFQLNLTKEQVIQLRAAGYKLRRWTDANDQAYLEEGDEEDAGVRTEG